MIQTILHFSQLHIQTASHVTPKEYPKYILDFIRFLPDKQLISQSSVAYYQYNVFKKHSSEDYGEELKAFLSSLSTDEVLNLHKTLMPLFTSIIGNKERLELVKIFTILGVDRMTTFAKQIHLLIPDDHTGSDLLYIAQLLSNIKLDDFRDLLVSAANQLFDWDTSNHHRTMILLYLYSKDDKELNKIISMPLPKKQELTRIICNTFP